jgi:1,4-alpha-glucan branching enzyme
MWAHPGKQLLFMGSELAEPREWSHDRGLDWSLLEEPLHAGVAELVRALNAVDAGHPALHIGDGDPLGFSWLDVNGAEQGVAAFERSEPGASGVLVCVANLSGVARVDYRIGLRQGGRWGAVLSTDDTAFGGHGGWKDDLIAADIPWHNRSSSAVLTLPPRSVTYLVPR